MNAVQQMRRCLKCVYYSNRLHREPVAKMNKRGCCHGDGYFDDLIASQQLCNRDNRFESKEGLTEEEIVEKIKRTYSDWRE